MHLSASRNTAFEDFGQIRETSGADKAGGAGFFETSRGVTCNCELQAWG